MKQFIIWPLDYSGGISFFGANILFNPFDMEICSGAVTYMKIQDLKPERRGSKFCYPLM